jgi:gas vesicle protein GvpO
MAASDNGSPLLEITISAVEQTQQLIGRPIESVTGIEKDGDGWTVSVEVLELERVPTTTDVLGKYEVTVDKNGELTAAQRTRRFPRAEAGEAYANGS